jgi:2,4-dienoyl-CoA reductase-like NADH-dependent reductase (Old Yellow Enzyme family)
MNIFEQSFSPIRIKNLEIKNRYVMSPMETKQANHDGSVSDSIVEYYRRRAEGGGGFDYGRGQLYSPYRQRFQNSAGH